MIGNNKIVLNQATMQEAIQYWLDSKTLDSLSKVTFVSKDDTEFVVSLSAPVKS